MDVIIEIPPVNAEQAVDGMRAAFLRPFGRGPVGRRIGGAAWSAFSAALVHGMGIDAASAMAQTAARAHNARTMLAARWSERRLTVAVTVAAASAAVAT